MTIDELKKLAEDLGFVAMAVGNEKYRIVLCGADVALGPGCTGTIERCAMWLDGWEARAKYDGY